jgi:3-deoxy-D-manno-octulosonic-acid transferase
LPCSIESKNNLKSLHVKKLSYIGNLKFSIKVNKTELRKSNLKILNNFKVWCAASTHEGEELVVLKTHLEIKKKYNNVLTIIIPRHISRAHHIKKLTSKFNLNSQVLNDGDKIDSSKEILIINSFGVLFQYFNYCKNIFIGKSLIKKLKMSGGQNPIEAAKFGCKIYYGPYVYNFKEVYSFLNSKNISQEIKNEFDLSKKLIKNFKHPEEIKDKNIDLLNDYGGKILSDTVVEINKIAKIKNENN